MNDQVVTTLIIAFFATLPPTLAAVGALIVALRNVRKTEQVSVRTDQIHEATNGNLSAVREQLQATQLENQQLRAELRLKPREHRTPATVAIAPADALLKRLLLMEAQLRSVQERLSADAAE